MTLPGNLNMSRVVYALSIKQPWAGLLVHGRKTIEVRTLVDVAARSGADPCRPYPGFAAEGWNRVTEDLRVACSQVGGIIGCAELTDCRAYRNRQEFEADTERHLNDPSWYEIRSTASCSRTPRRCRFDAVGLDAVFPRRGTRNHDRILTVRFRCTNPTRKLGILATRRAGEPHASNAVPQLLVSVRSPAEAEAALAGGAASSTSRNRRGARSAGLTTPRSPRWFARLPVGGR